MTQQTIGNTVYRVGQELKNYTEAAALLDYMAVYDDTDFNLYRSKAGSKCAYVVSDFIFEHFPITILALPNPDPVAEDWREVVLAKFRKPYRYEKQDDYINEAVEFIEQGRLQLAMQEVVKADGAKKVVLPDWHPYYTPAGTIFEKRLDPMDVQIIMTCFLLGGKVSVKGGV